MNIPFNRPSEAEGEVADFTNIFLLPVKSIEERCFIAKAKKNSGNLSGIAGLFCLFRSESNKRYTKVKANTKARR